MRLRRLHPRPRRRAIAAATLYTLFAGSIALASVTVSPRVQTPTLTSTDVRRTVPLPTTTGRLRTIVGATSVDLGSALGKVAGEIGDRQLTVTVEQKGPGLALEGTLGKRKVDLDVAPGGIRGALGICQWTMMAAGGAYHGTRQCGPSSLPERFTLLLPERMEGLNDGERATVLLALLGPPPAEKPPEAKPVRARPPTNATGALRGERDVEQKLGFSTRPGTTGMGSGAEVSHVLPESPAAKAGLEEGMIIMRAGDRRIHGPKDLTDALVAASSVSTTISRLEVIDAHTGARRFIPFELAPTVRQDRGVGGSGQDEFEFEQKDIDDTPTEDFRPVPDEVLR